MVLIGHHDQPMAAMKSNLTTFDATKSGFGTSKLANKPHFLSELNPELPPIGRGDALQVSEASACPLYLQSRHWGRRLGCPLCANFSREPRCVRTRAVVYERELQERIGGVWCWLLVSRHRHLTLDRRKRGHAFQPGMA